MGDNFDALMQETNILKNLPRTRDVNVLQVEYDELNLTIGAALDSIITFNEKIDTYTTHVTFRAFLIIMKIQLIGVL